MIKDKVQRKYYKKHKKEINKKKKEYTKKYPHILRKARLKREYNLTLEEYDKMYNEQHGRCAICSQPETKIYFRTGLVQRLCVDHNHKTNIVRKLLCDKCNRLLSLADENVDLLYEVINYLNEYK